MNTVCVLVTTSILLFPGCLLNKNGSSDLTKDGIRISVAVTPDTLPVDSILTVTVTVENTSSAPALRAFTVGSEGEPMVGMHYFVPSFEAGAGFFGKRHSGNVPDTLRLAPRAKAIGIWHYRVHGAGTTWVVGCFPEHNDATVPGVCASREVTLKAK